MFNPSHSRIPPAVHRDTKKRSLYETDTRGDKHIYHYHKIKQVLQNLQNSKPLHVLLQRRGSSSLLLEQTRNAPVSGWWSSPQGLALGKEKKLTEGTRSLVCISQQSKEIIQFTSSEYLAF